MRLALALVVGCALAGAPTTDGGARHSADGGALSPPRYEIDGKEVTAAQFQARLATLHGKEDWLCAETSDGGLVRYIARDVWGRRFQVVESSSAAPSSIRPAME